MAAKPNLKKLLKTWQTRLRLQDTDITIQYAGKEMMGGRVGETRHNWSHGHARILILDPAVNVEPWAAYRNVELTLVHELLHIVLGPVNPENEFVADWNELAIEKIAKALLEI